MKLIQEAKFNRQIVKNFEHQFNIQTPGLYVLEIKVRAKSWLQNTSRLISLFKDDDLAIKIDSIEFPKLSGKKGLFDSEAAWNGNLLKNLQQINIFLIDLEAGDHLLNFLVDGSPYLETLKIYQIQDEEKVTLEPDKNYQVESGDRRPWLNFILVNLAVKKLFVTGGAAHRNGDDDNLQLRINGQRQINDTPKSHPYWYWCGKILKGQTKIFEKEINLPRGIHYLEFWSDRTPLLKKVIFQLGEGLPSQAAGRVAIYKDVSPVSEINLRSEPKQQSGSILIVPNHERVIILEKAVGGSPPEGLMSDLWHRVLYKGKQGFILSSFVEMPGQERPKIIEKIRVKTKELGLDENLALNLAHCESKWLPFAHSKTDNKGIYQLGQETIQRINEKLGGRVVDPYDIDQNIDGGLRYFKDLLERYKGSVNYLERVITAWSRGPGRISKDEPFIFTNLPPGTQVLLDCVLKEKRGKKVLRISALLLITILVLHGLIFLKDTQPIESVKIIESIDRNNFDYDLKTAEEGEIILGNIQSDLDNDGQLEIIKFGTYYTDDRWFVTRIHPPNSEPVEVEGSLFKSFVQDLDNDRVKELVVEVKSGQLINAVVFVYKEGGLSRLPVYDETADPYDGFETAGMPAFKDLDQDGVSEVVLSSEGYADNWRELVQYYKWDGEGYRLYQEKKVIYDECGGEPRPCAGG